MDQFEVTNAHVTNSVEKAECWMQDQNPLSDDRYYYVVVTDGQVEGFYDMLGQKTTQRRCEELLNG